jgi:hypothetical protein
MHLSKKAIVEFKKLHMKIPSWNDKSIDLDNIGG